MQYIYIIAYTQSSMSGRFTFCLTFVASLSWQWVVFGRNLMETETGLHLR